VPLHLGGERKKGRSVAKKSWGVVRPINVLGKILEEKKVGGGDDGREVERGSMTPSGKGGRVLLQERSNLSEVGPFATKGGGGAP